ncbi:MAG: chorismate synthase [Ruminococcaceae bacterium]|nr:chorismate synthase [Oscillospiraceae bacterium]
MKNSFGKALTLTLFGESHGEAIGCVLDGLAPGAEVDPDAIRLALSRRRPAGQISTGRREPDEFRIVSGVYEGKATGTPLCILIPNVAQHSKDYAKNAPYRPGHADFTAEMKYHGFQDPRGGGHFSGRLTAPLVAAGAILRGALAKKGIVIGTHIAAIHGVKDTPFEGSRREMEYLENAPFPTLSAEAGEKMQAEILAAREKGNSVGGILETAVSGMPAGVGEPWFDTMEGELSHALFSIPAVKGLEFGAGFGFAELYGSEANDAFICENGVIRTRTNQNGGINGGITNGMPLTFRTVIKPTPTVSVEQDTVSPDGTALRLAAGGRHDPCIVHRACIVQNSVTALVLYDALAARYGTDYFGECR